MIFLIAEVFAAYAAQKHLFAMFQEEKFFIIAVVTIKVFIG